jgi:hypothetical protein
MDIVNDPGFISENTPGVFKDLKDIYIAICKLIEVSYYPPNYALENGGRFQNIEEVLNSMLGFQYYLNDENYVYKIVEYASLRALQLDLDYQLSIHFTPTSITTLGSNFYQNYRKFIL